MEYKEFLANRLQLNNGFGFNPKSLPDYLYDFQAALCEWAIIQGRAAIFADCGLGKTPMQITWADSVLRETNKSVLILAPLAVTQQTIREGEKFGIEIHKADPYKTTKGIQITNYEQLEKFSREDFGAVVCDESSILKSFDGAYRKGITEFMKKMKYRLLCTATAAPNDFIELGTSSEALGYLGHVDMLNRFFKNNLSNSAQGRAFGGVVKWRFKGHAEESFWRWVTSWGRCIRKPSDLGFDDGDFILPPIHEQEHIVKAGRLKDGMLFDLPAQGLQEQREEQRRTIVERCEKVSELVSSTKKPALVWCQLNDEGDLLEKMIKDGVQVKGSDSVEKKESRLLGFADGDFRVLITKPKIGAWGLNYQHCSHVTFFPSHSFEQYYQGVRRCWRFGQKNEVKVDVVTTEGGAGIVQNVKRKSRQADAMFENLNRNILNAQTVKTNNNYNIREEVPQWL